MLRLATADDGQADGDDRGREEDALDVEAEGRDGGLRSCR